MSVEENQKRLLESGPSKKKKKKLKSKCISVLQLVGIGKSFGLASSTGKADEAVED